MRSNPIIASLLVVALGNFPAQSQTPQSKDSLAKIKQERIFQAQQKAAEKEGNKNQQPPATPVKQQQAGNITRNTFIDDSLTQSWMLGDTLLQEQAPDLAPVLEPGWQTYQKAQANITVKIRD